MPTTSQPAPRRKLNVKKGDTVQVITGKDRGVKGKVILTLPAVERVLVEGVNRVKKHTRVGTNQRGAQTGGIVTQEAPVHISNVMVVCPSCDKPSRMGHRKDTVEKRRADGTTYESQRSVRVCKRCGEDV